MPRTVRNVQQIDLCIISSLPGPVRYFIKGSQQST